MQTGGEWEEREGAGKAMCLLKGQGLCLSSSSIKKSKQGMGELIERETTLGWAFCSGP